MRHHLSVNMSQASGSDRNLYNKQQVNQVTFVNKGGLTL